MLCEMRRECARDHYQVDKARAIRDEDRMTGRLNFSRICEKCGLEFSFHSGKTGITIAYQSKILFERNILFINLLLF